MAAQTTHAFATVDEYLAFDRASDERNEYYAGEIVAMSGASFRHERLVINLTGILYNTLRGKPCQPNGGNLRVRVRQANFVYPDLTVVCGEPRFSGDEPLDTLLNPSVVFEILSPSTEGHDRGQKWRLYQQIESLEHYVLIHQDSARVEVYTRHGDVDWVLHAEQGLGGTVSLPTLGVEFETAALYESIALPPSDEG